MKIWRHFEKPDTRRNMPVLNEKPPPVSVQGIFKKAQSLRQKIKPAKTVQQIFQEAQKSARKSSEKLRQKAPPQVQSALPSGASFFILTIILIFGGAGIAALLAPILAPIVILCAIAGIFFSDD